MIEDRVAGNSCIFCLFRTATLCLLFAGLGSLAAGIAVCADAGNFSWYNGSYIGLGVFVVVLAGVGHKTKYSVPGLTCYLLTLILVFLAELGFTLGIIFYTDYSNILGEEKANAVRYSLLGGCAIILFCIVVGYCYRNSLKDREFYAHNQPLKNTTTNYETPKTNAKRQEMASKYDQLKSKWASQ